MRRFVEVRISPIDSSSDGDDFEAARRAAEEAAAESTTADVEAGSVTHKRQETRVEILRDLRRQFAHLFVGEQIAHRLDGAGEQIHLRAALAAEPDESP